MGNQRLFLWAIFGLILWLCYEAWQRDYHPQQPASASAVQQTGAPSPAVPAADALDKIVPAPASPPAQTPAPAAQQPTSPPATAATGEIAVAATETGAQPKVHVRTDVLDVDIGLIGGTLRRAELPLYPLQKTHGDVPVRLFDDNPEHPYLLKSGLSSGDATPQPNHLATFSAAAQDYRLAEGQKEISIPLTWTSEQGLKVTKTFTFHRGSYTIDLDYTVDNQTGAPWKGVSYIQFLRQQPHVERSMFNVETYAFKGPAMWDGARYKKLKIEDEEDSRMSQDVTNGWIASMQHHFVVAAIPPAGQQYHFQLNVRDQTFLLSATSPTRTVNAGEQQHFTEKLFVGPKLQNQLAGTGPELDRTADYGHLHLIAKPLFAVLDWVHRVVHNWGVTIIIVTFLLKLLFYPLSEASGRSMAKMRLLAPRIKNLQERYKDNREQLGRAMMDIYKREKINPLAGCLPMLVQIPVFLAFYWVLLESVEMRQAPFMLWINDLSSRDPYFILPLLMGAAMFGQFKLNPAPPDPVQAKIFMIMPIAMTAMFAFFPSGLVLYWLTNTLLSIAQQWNINRRIERAKKASN